MENPYCSCSPYGESLLQLQPRWRIPAAAVGGGESALTGFRAALGESSAPTPQLIGLLGRLLARFLANLQVHSGTKEMNCRWIRQGGCISLVPLVGSIPEIIEQVHAKLKR